MESGLRLVDFWPEQSHQKKMQELKKMFTLSTFELFIVLLRNGMLFCIFECSFDSMMLSSAPPYEGSAKATLLAGTHEAPRTASGVCCVIGARFGEPFVFVTLFTIQRERDREKTD